ncbi:MAG: choice-of-anchor D domain-containing protein, partial [Ignavibacteria bacterium]|nr:choice-of-anchor D domain-containing protein [Ignavibacteria bacterium]
MKFKILLILIFGVSLYKLQSQNLVGVYPFPANTAYNGFWGVTEINDTLRIGSSSGGKIYKVTKNGVILDSLATPFTFNQGLAWDGNGFWIARNASSLNSRVIKISPSGTILDTIRINSLYGNTTIGIGGIALEGNNLWIAIYYPDFPTYPFAWAYKINLTSRQFVDSIPLRGKQVQGITLKGDTILYVTDNFQGDEERIYAYSRTSGDTLFSFPAPDPDNDCDPRGLWWDGSHLYLIAYRIGGSVGQYRNLYKYQLTGAGSPVIITNPNSINFGNVLINTTANRNLAIINQGTANLIISLFTITDPRFSITPNTVPDTIAPSQTKNYNIGFTPNVYDSISGELRISSNDNGSPVKIVTLSGRGIYSGPYIASSHTSLTFPNRRINCLTGGTFTITNQGNQQLVINSVNFSTPRFRFDTINVQFPVLIDPQVSRTFRIWFNPNATSSFSDSAVFNTNAVNQLTIQLSGSGVNTQTSLGDIMWESNIPANPRTSFQDYQPKSMKMIPDVNADGKPDLIVCTGNYWTICYNGNASVSADTLWKFNTHFGSINTGPVEWEDAMQIINDIDGDGINDVVIGCAGGNEMVYALSGRNGRKIWEYGNPNTTSDGDIMGIRTDRDYNNDSRNDVLISASGDANFSGRHAVICVNGLNGQVIFNVTQPYNFTYDVESLPAGGAIGTGNNGGPYFLRGFDNSGQNIWSYTLSSAAWSVKRIPDINNDNYPDLVGLQGFAGSVYAVSGINGLQIWTQSLGS